MKITTTSGTWDLENDSIPTDDEKNAIIDSVTCNDQEFIALVKLSAAFPADLTVEQFHAECVAKTEWGDGQ